MCVGGHPCFLAWILQKIFERQPFRFGCIVFNDSNLDNESKNENVNCLEQTQNYPINNFEEKQSEIVNKDPIVFKIIPC